MKKILTTVFGIIFLSVATIAIIIPINRCHAENINETINVLSKKTEFRQKELDRLIYSLGIFSNVNAKNPQKSVATPTVQAISFYSIDKPQIPDLSFKQIMRMFYGSQLSSISVNDAEINNIPHVGLSMTDDFGAGTVALMHPVVNYNNLLLEPRFLVMIEKVEISNGMLSNTCAACAATADLYSFKRLPNGRFQLVSRSPEGADFYGAHGRIDLDIKKISTSIKSLGKNLIGSVFKDGGGGGQGEAYFRWIALHLPEDNFINYYKLGDAGGNNDGAHEKESPLHYSYEVELNILENDEEHYPIILTYIGGKPNETYDRIIDVSFSKVVKFDPVEKKYK